MVEGEENEEGRGEGSVKGGSKRVGGDGNDNRGVEIVPQSVSQSITKSTDRSVSKYGPFERVVGGNGRGRKGEGGRGNRRGRK